MSGILMMLTRVSGRRCTANLVVVGLVGMSSALALAQVPPSATTSNSAVPAQASPAIGNDAMSRDYLRAARVALLAGHTVEAGQSLALAESSAPGRPVAVGVVTMPNSSLYLARISDARRALGNGDSRYAISLIDVALLH